MIHAIIFRLPPKWNQKAALEQAKAFGMQSRAVGEQFQIPTGQTVATRFNDVPEVFPD
jgi:hypothetical protein